MTISTVILVKFHVIYYLYLLFKLFRFLKSLLNCLLFCLFKIFWFVGMLSRSEGRSFQAGHRFWQGRILCCSLSSAEDGNLWGSWAPAIVATLPPKLAFSIFFCDWCLFYLFLKLYCVKLCKIWTLQEECFCKTLTLM